MTTKLPAVTAAHRVTAALATIDGLRLAAVLPKTRRADREIHAAVDRVLDAVEAQLRDPAPAPAAPAQPRTLPANVINIHQRGTHKEAA